MNRRKLGIVVIGAVALGVAVWAVRWASTPGNSIAPSQAQAARGVSITVANAVKKKTPVKVEALGTVSPIASVAIKPRVDSEISEIRFSDGATVRAGDVLIKLDSRSIEAQIQAAEGLVARDQAQLEGAERDVRRYTELVSKNATPVTNLDNAKTQAAVYTAAKLADEGALANLRVQLSYTTIRAPISGRISAAAVKVGNFVRSADTTPIATIIQVAPIYVTFSVPQKVLPDIRRALAAETATIEASVPGEQRKAAGTVTMIENTVDPGTGMVLIRATMPNTDEFLWPGTLVTAQITLREEEAVTVPSAAIQVSQAGSFVFVVKDGKAHVRHVKVARVVGTETALEEGVEDGEAVVTDGFLLLTDGSAVVPRSPKAGT